MTALAEIDVVTDDSCVTIFECFCQDTLLGDTMYVVGNIPELGNWDPFKGLPLFTSAENFPAWRSPRYPLSTLRTFPVEFKFVIITGGNRAVRWETTANRKLDLGRLKMVQGQHNRNCLLVCTSFDARDVTISAGTESMFDEACAFGLASNIPKNHPLETPTIQSTGDSEVDLSNAVRKPLSPAECIVVENNTARSYLEKLRLVERILLEHETKDGVGVENLAAAYVYLSFIRSGAIKCLENGRHFRPNHHAAVAQRLFSGLTRLTSAAATVAAVEQHPKGLGKSSFAIILLVRKIMPFLPSFSPSFTCAAPLTRIRDIAHRNDIPYELKQRLKHTLQNKLHRCAGPEDLATAELILEELLSSPPGMYSSSFLSEYRLFCEELREFFSTRQLEELLVSFCVKADSSTQEFVDEFLKLKREFQNEDLKTDCMAVIDILHTATEVRRFLTNRGVFKSQTGWLVDISFGDYVFSIVSQAFSPVLSREANYSSKTFIPNKQILEILILVLQHAAMNGFLPLEATVLSTSLSWLLLLLDQDTESDNGFRFALTSELHFRTTEEALLYTRGLLERTRRYTEMYQDVVAGVFPEAAELIGKPLGVPEHAIRVFAEADVRSSLSYQISRIVSYLLETICHQLGTAEGVDVVVGPDPRERVVGMLIQLDKLADVHRVCSGIDATMPKIISLNKVSGDEEVEILRDTYFVCAIIVTHPVAHLSHLSIRAREAHIPLYSVLWTTSSFAEDVRKHSNSIVEIHNDAQIHLTVLDSLPQDSRTFKRKLRSQTPKNAFEGEKESQRIVEENRRQQNGLVVYDDSNKIISPLCGPKGAACARLLDVLKGVPRCKAPSVWCFPFGTLEYLIEKKGLGERFHHILANLDLLPISVSEERLTPWTDAMQDLVDHAIPTAHDLREFTRQLQVYAHATNRPIKRIPLILRSSANLEDLEGMSSAGLYDSISNVTLCMESSTFLFGKAMTTVWASLFSPRAVLHRKALGIPQSAARMSIVVQELLIPYISFVMHTRWPLSCVPLSLQNDAKDIEQGFFEDHWIYVELALGQGEILASGCAQGQPHKIAIHKFTEHYRILGFSSYAVRYTPPEPGNECTVTYKANHKGLSPLTFLNEDIIDYSHEWFTKKLVCRDVIVRSLRNVGCLLESHFKGPQDIEGGILIDDKLISKVGMNEEETEKAVELYIAQSRAQPE